MPLSIVRRMTSVVFVLLALVLCMVHVDGYKHGDHVSMLKMTQYQGYRTAWTELVSEFTPRFGMDRSVKLHTMSSSKVYNAYEEFKISFSFDHEKFLTSWITITDGEGSSLHYIQFDFIYTGDHIQSVKWKPVYYEEDKKGELAEYVYIRYHWKEMVESDAALGLDVLLTLSVIFAYTCMGMILFGWDKKKCKSKAV